jgi:hypothetical protein
VRVFVRVCFTMLPSPVTCGVVFTTGITWAASQQHAGIAAIVVSVVTRSDIVTRKMLSCCELKDECHWLLQ